MSMALSQWFNRRETYEGTGRMRYKQCKNVCALPENIATVSFRQNNERANPKMLPVLQMWPLDVKRCFVCE